MSKKEKEEEKLKQIKISDGFSECRDSLDQTQIEKMKEVIFNFFKDYKIWDLTFEKDVVMPSKGYLVSAFGLPVATHLNFACLSVTNGKYCLKTEVRLDITFFALTFDDEVVMICEDLQGQSFYTAFLIGCIL